MQGWVKLNTNTAKAKKAKAPIPNNKGLSYRSMVLSLIFEPYSILLMTNLNREGDDKKVMGGVLSFPVQICHE